MIPRTINYEWLTWGVTSVVRGGLDENIRSRIDAERTRADALRVIVQTFRIPWVEDRSLPARFVDQERRLSTAWRRGAEITFGVHAVSLERFGGNGAGPGFGFAETRIHLGGRVAGRAWTMGCSLGAGGACGPAVAMLRDDLALRVTHDARHLELITRRDAGDSSLELLAATGASVRP